MNTQDKTLLMIRALDQAKNFVTEIAVTNPVMYAPMVRIEVIKPNQTMHISDALIFTSSNAVRIYAKLSENRTAKVFCVGAITAQSAQNQGFSVKQTFSTAADLITTIPRSINTQTVFTYPRAESVSVDIATALSNNGFLVNENILYRQKFQPLSKQALDTIESSFVVIPILSKEIAFRFNEVLKNMKIKSATLVCISPDVAAVFPDLQSLNVEIAKKPERESLFTAIKAALAK